MNISESYKKLSKYSDLVETITSGNTSRIVSLRGIYGVQTEEITFHPNGKCGCIELNDEEMFGIRCNHLMWAEGFVEGTESFMQGINRNEAILVYGNHKGSLEVELLTCSDKEDTSSYVTP